MIEILMRRRRLLGLVVVMMTLVGIAAYFNMARQEDPSFPYRAGLITVQYPGATAETVERLIIRPLEDELLQLEEINFVASTSRSGVGLVNIMLRDRIYATTAAWDRVRQAMERARVEFPEGVGQMALEDRLIDTPVVVLALSGSASIGELSRRAEDLKDALIGLPALSRIEIEGQADEQITIAVDDAELHRVGLTPQQLAGLIGQRNQVVPGGFVVAGGKRLTVLANSEFVSLDDLRTTQIPLPDGSFVPLAGLADIWRGPREPLQSETWRDGERVVLLNVLAQRGQVDALAFGKALRERVAEVAPEFAPLQIDEMFFQPEKVAERLEELEGSLLMAVLIIVGVVFVGMGLRMGLLVAITLPVVALISLGLYNLGGGVLHQIAVIALVISLGILIDNAIVMVENVQTRLSEGADRVMAVTGAVRELAAPLGASTATTLAAFTPLLLSRGGTADFTRAIPIMIMLTLSVSYLLAVTVAPMIAARFLSRETAPRSGWVLKLGERLATLSTGRPKLVLGVGALMVVFSFLITPLMALQFFPNADRPKVILDLHLPEGTDQSYTAMVAERIEREVRRHETAHSVHRFVGTTGPTFYYNLVRFPEAPNRARLVVTASDLDATRQLMQDMRAFVRDTLPEVELSAFQLGQGPPRDSPVEVRVFHPNDTQRMVAAEQIYAHLRAVRGSVDVRHDLDFGTPAVRVDVDDAVAQRSGLNRADVARTLFGQSYGLTAEQYRQERDAMPLVVRSVEGTALPLTRLLSVNVYPENGEPVPVMQVARVYADWEPAGIKRRNGERVFRINANLEDGYSFSQVLAALEQRLAEQPLPRGTRIEYGGDSEGSGDANQALATSAPIGVLLLLFFLVWQFNSFRRVAIVLLTVPMAAVGIIPGLVISGAPFGFMSMLGVVALVGIVVNNAIVLIDVIDQRLAEGFAVRDAVFQAVARRTRPILLTTATTVAGLLPLAFTQSTLWPPMAWAIISGLLASTMLTLLVVPALCLLTFRAPEATRAA
ncbi:efflux RND transporter permease subunit [Isoalcanivorax indicus]|uniref:efflux RND transporter permease subunit n=1 Tax=Isoalcanivorax indicus TaxID=2202653 RepID=UPI000DBA0415|nr:efflux RND transporter permease subunit [Isoalcanivorax indicus]